MAFSTQKDLMEVGFMNSNLEPINSNKAVKIKTYPSTTDTRAWSINNKKQANFFADLVASRTCALEENEDIEIDMKDIKQLQDIINKLKKENAELRFNNSIVKTNKSTSTLASKKSECGMVSIVDYNKIVQERNILNDKLCKMMGLEEKIALLKKRAMDADKFEEELKCRSHGSDEQENLKLKDQLHDLKNQCYENQRKVQDMQIELKEINCLKTQNNNLMNELRVLSCKLERSQSLEQKLYLAEHQICVNERIIQDYEYQFNQLMMVIEELEGKPCCCDTTNALVKDGHLHDLTLATKATIDQIKLEMCVRGKLQEEIHNSKMELAKFKIKAKTDIDQLQKDRDNILQETSNKSACILNDLEKYRNENKNLIKFVSQVKSGLIEELCSESLSQIGVKEDYKIPHTREFENKISEIKNSDLNIYRLDIGSEKIDKEKIMYNLNLKKEYTCDKMSILETDNFGPEKISFGFTQEPVPGTDAVGFPVHVKIDSKFAEKFGINETNTSSKCKIDINDKIPEIEKISLTKCSIETTKDEIKKETAVSSSVPLTHTEKVEESEIATTTSDQFTSGKPDYCENIYEFEIIANSSTSTHEKFIANMIEVNEIDAKSVAGLRSNDNYINEIVSHDIEQCLKALEMLKKEFRDAKENHELEKAALKKIIAENKKLQDELEEENDKYKLQREKSKHLDKLKTDLESKQDNLKNKLIDSNEALISQKSILEEQNKLLTVSKAELEKHRKELIKSKEDITSLETLNESAQATNKKLNENINTKQQEISNLNDKIKELMNKVVKLEESMKMCDFGTKSMAEELENLKTRFANLTEQSSAKENALKEANNNLIALYAENEALNNEIKQNRKDLNNIQALVGDIEVQRTKNKDLECLLKNYENKLSVVVKPITVFGEANIQDAIYDLKKQLENAEAENNKLTNELKISLGELRILKSQIVDPPTKNNNLVASKINERKFEYKNKGVTANMIPAVCDTKGLQETSSKSSIIGVNTAVKHHVKSLEKRHSQSLLRLQNIYDDQMRDLVDNHEREIQALKTGEKKICGHLTKLPVESKEIKQILFDIKNRICTCKKSLREMTKMQRICHKINDKGIELLNVKELTHLHGEVYKAGLRLKPELLKHCDEKQKCCKCTEFSCCLPHLSKEMEKKLISRIIFLEKEVEKANQILLHLKEKYSDRSPICYQFNEDLNDLLKTFCSDAYQMTNRSKKSRCLSCHNFNNQLNRKCKSARLTSKNKNQCDIPTRDYSNFG